MKYNTNQRLILISSGAWAIFDAFTSTFLVAFALLFGASNFVIGLLGAMPYLVSLIIEFPGAKLVEFFSRKKIYLIAQTISRISWALIILIPPFFQEKPLLFLTLFFAWIKLSDIIIEPAWVSLAADLVPQKIRGRFFGTRNMIVGMAGMLAAIIGGLYLDLFPSGTVTGFVSLFTAGIFFAIISLLFFSRIHEPKTIDNTHHKLKEFFSFRGDLKKFCIFAFCFNFAVMLASPFFSVYMLKNLNLSYSLFTLSSALSTVARILAQKRIGRLTDKYGDKPVALLSVFGTSLTPFLFLFVTPDTLWLLIVAQIVSGIVWAGADLTLFNLLLDLTQAEKRATQVAGYAMLIAIPNIIGPLIGGLIADYGGIYFLTGIPLVFFISFILRIVTATLIFKIQEPRIHKTYPLTEVFHHALSLHPSRGLEYRIKVIAKKLGNKYGILR